MQLNTCGKRCKLLLLGVEQTVFLLQIDLRCYSAVMSKVTSQHVDLMYHVCPPCQVLVNCVTANQSHGCNGGDPTAAYSYIQEHGIVDETCQNYQARNAQCDSIDMCRSCNHERCWAVKKRQYSSYGITEHGQVGGCWCPCYSACY